MSTLQLLQPALSLSGRALFAQDEARALRAWAAAAAASRGKEGRGAAPRVQPLEDLQGTALGACFEGARAHSALLANS